MVYARSPTNVDSKEYDRRRRETSMILYKVVHVTKKHRQEAIAPTTAPELSNSSSHHRYAKYKYTEQTRVENQNTSKPDIGHGSAVEA